MKKLILICLIFSTGCAIRKNLETPITTPENKPSVDDGSNPTDPTQGTKYCKPNANNQFDGTSIPIESGQTPQDGSAWAEGGGCILKSIRETWATFNNLEYMKFGAANSFTYTRTINPDPGITHLYEITYSKSTIIGPIDWTIDWFHSFDRGTFEAPERVNINYQRTRGTSNIPIWHGGIVLTKVNSSVTSITVRNEFKARQSNSDNESSAKSALNEMIRSARSGTPDWSRLNTGLKDNPDEADAPVAAAPVAQTSFCTPDTSGQYPAQADVHTSIDNGVSTVKVRACVLKDAASVYAALKNPAAIHWSNATSVTTNSATSVTYTKSKFLKHDVKWTMTWQFDDTKLSTTYKIDPATPDFPVWSGSVAITPIASGVSEIDFSNELLTDTVSESASTNSGLATDYINAVLGLLK